MADRPALPPGVERTDDGWVLRKRNPCPDGWEWQYPNGMWGPANRTVPASYMRDVPIRPETTTDE